MGKTFWDYQHDRTIIVDHIFQKSIVGPKYKEGVHQESTKRPTKKYGSPFLWFK